ncbi:T9SS type A sorting domain-containing protein [Flaviaesturariibacter terrae]
MKQTSLLLFLLCAVPATLFAQLPQPNGYLYLYGNLHAHSSYSDGNKENTSRTPKDDYEFARDANCFDFLGISEHNHATAGLHIANYRVGYDQANLVNGVPSAVTGKSIVTLWGMEWGVISNGGHVLVYGFDNQLIGWEPNNYDIFVAKNDYNSLWPIVAARTGAFATLAHPQPFDYAGLFNNAYNAAADNALVGVAVESGPAFSTATNYSDFPSSLSYLDYYKNMLAKGYHLAPQMDQDTHYFTFGESNSNRMVVLATARTRAAIMEAVRANRFYASEDCNVKVDFKSGQSVMGSSLEKAGVPALSLNVSDLDLNDTLAIAELWGAPINNAIPAGPIKTFVAPGTSVTFDAANPENSQPNGDTWYYYFILRQGDGNKIVTAPIWYKRNDAMIGTAVSSVTPTAKPYYAVFPNPSRGITGVYSTSASSEAVVIKVVDGMGRLVQLMKGHISNGNPAMLDLSAQPKGTYFVIVEGQKTLLTKTIVLQ